MKHKIPNIRTGRIVDIPAHRYCRVCGCQTLHYKLGRSGWVCTRVVSALRKSGVKISY